MGKHLENGQDGASIKYLPSTLRGRHFSLVRSGRLAPWIQEHADEFDVAHIHFARELFLLDAAKACMKRGLPYVLQPHGMLNTSGPLHRVADAIFVRRALREASACLALQDVEAKRLAQIEPKSTIVDLPNGIEAQVVPIPLTPRHGNVVLFAARFDARKRPREFVRMAAILHRQDPKLLFVMIGPDAGELEATRNLAGQLLPEGVVDVRGHVPLREKKELFESCIAYVLPSVDEPFPMSVLETLSVGTPTVVTDSCHIAPLLRLKGAALVSKPDAQSLANAVLKARVPKNAKLLGERAAKLMQEELNMDIVGQKLEVIYARAAAH